MELRFHDFRVFHVFPSFSVFRDFSICHDFREFHDFRDYEDDDISDLDQGEIIYHTEEGEGQNHSSYSSLLAVGWSSLPRLDFPSRIWEIWKGSDTINEFVE